MNERDLDEFLNDPGDLFARQCEELWNELWEISNDGERSMALREIAELLSRYLELPAVYDRASATEREQIDPILMTIWTEITQPLAEHPDIAPATRSAAIDEVAKCARGLMDVLGKLGGLSIDENLLLTLSLKVCADMAWQLPKPPEARQPKHE